MNIRKNSPAFAEHIILNALCRNGTAEDVLRQYLKCGYNCICISDQFYQYEKKTKVTSKLPHPFVTACEHANLPVVKLFLVLGANPKTPLMERGKSPLDVFTDNAELHQLLSDGLSCEDRHFPEELAELMKGLLEASILKKDYYSAFIYGMQGLRITDCSFVYTRDFQDQPVLKQAFVYRMLMPSQQKRDIARKIEKVCGKKYIPSVLQRAINSDTPAFAEKLKKIMDSADLLPEEHVSYLVNSMLTDEEQISLLQRISENPDEIRASRTLQLIKDKLFEKLLFAVIENTELPRRR